MTKANCWRKQLVDFLQVQTEGTRDVERIRKFYNLGVLSVGYRVQSRVATRFRIWATERLPGVHRERVYDERRTAKSKLGVGTILMKQADTGYSVVGEGVLAGFGYLRDQYRLRPET